MWKGSPESAAKLRSAFLFLVLGGALILSGVLAYQAQDAIRSQQRTAASVVEGYALLAGREFIRRVDSDVSYYGILTALQPLDGELLPDPDSLGPEVRGRDLVGGYFRWEPGADHPNWQGKEDLQMPPAAVWEGLRARAADYDADWLYALFAGPDPGGPLLVYRVKGEPAGETIEGLLADQNAFGARLGKILDGSPLLPLSIEGRAVDNALFGVSILDNQGRIWFRSRTPYPDSVTVTERFRRGLGDLHLVVEVQRQAGSKLIIGGLPGSRIPLLLGLLILTSGLILTALFQLRRERRFARRQAEFIASVSHELRTPLAQVQMFADTLLLERFRSPEEQQRSLEILSQETRRLTHLVENVLQFSRSQRQTAQLATRPLDPLPLIEETLEHFRPLAESSRCSVRIVAPPEAVRIEADPEAFRRILLNLFDNAVKYGPPGQQVVVSVEPLENSLVRIGVEDQGSGIPESDRQRIWRRFERLDRHRDAAVAGTGIGLTVVRELVEAQGGQVWVEDGKGGGALFQLVFPAAVRSARAREEVRNDG